MVIAMHVQRLGIFVMEELRTYGSVRIRGANLIAPLREYCDAVPLCNLSRDMDLDAVIVPQKTAEYFPWDELPRGVITIFDACEFFTDELRKRDFYQYCAEASIITVGSVPLWNYLKTKIIGKPVIYIPDMVEVSYDLKEHKKSTRMKVFWYGFGGNYKLIEPYIQEILKLDFVDFVWMSDHPKATYGWDITHWEKCLADADVGICPYQDATRYPSIVDFKGGHKVTSFMAKGIPVIASPLGEYKNVIRHGESGFIAQTLEQWRTCFDQLQDPSLRNAIGMNAFRTAEKYAPSRIACIYNKLINAASERTGYTEVEAEISREYVQLPQVKLHLGCGGVYRRGYVNVDRYEIDVPSPSFKSKVDVFSDVRHLGFADSCADVIECYHTIEHMYRWEADEGLHEMFRILKWGGRLVLECPDLEKCCRNYLRAPNDLSAGLFGIYGDPRYRHPAISHHWGYAWGELSRALIEAGFKRVIQTMPLTHDPLRDMRIEAFRDFDDVVLAPKEKCNTFWKLVRSLLPAVREHPHPWLWVNDVPEGAVICEVPTRKRRGIQEIVVTSLAYRRENHLLVLFLKCHGYTWQIRRIFMHAYPHDRALLTEDRLRHGFANLDHAIPLLPHRWYKKKYYVDYVDLSGLKPGFHRIVWGFLNEKLERIPIHGTRDNTIDLGSIEVRREL